MTESASNNGWYRFPIRVRAHCNPLSIEGFEYPRNPQLVPWETMYANNIGKPSFLDVGCAYGGLLCDLGSSFPDINFLGAEIRDKVVQFSQDRVKQLREKENTHQNVWFIRTNAMKYLPNYFSKGQLSVMTFCFPDPHFKRKNYRRRIISSTLVSEYAYFLKKGGYLFTITDVEELGKWMQKHLDESPQFERVSKQDLIDTKDPLLITTYEKIHHSSEDAKRTESQNLNMYCAVFRRK